MHARQVLAGNAAYDVAELSRMVPLMHLLSHFIRADSVRRDGVVRGGSVGGARKSPSSSPMNMITKTNKNGRNKIG